MICMHLCIYHSLIFFILGISVDFIVKIVKDDVIYGAVVSTLTISWHWCHSYPQFFNFLPISSMINSDWTERLRAMMGLWSFSTRRRNCQVEVVLGMFFSRLFQFLGIFFPLIIASHVKRRWCIQARDNQTVPQ